LLQAGISSIEFLTPPFILGQLHYSGQVGFGKTLHLLSQGSLRFP